MLNKQNGETQKETISFIEEKISQPAPLKPNPALKDAMHKMEKKFRWF